MDPTPTPIPSPQEGGEQAADGGQGVEQDPAPSPSPQEGGERAAAGVGPEVDWAGLRVAYETSDVSVAALRRRFGASAHFLRLRRKREGWTLRPSPCPRATPETRRRRGAEAMLRRLDTLVAAGALSLRRQIAEEGIREEHARLMTELCRAGEIVVRANKTSKITGKAGARGGAAGETKIHDERDGAGEPPFDAAAARAELKARLDRLRERQGALRG